MSTALPQNSTLFKASQIWDWLTVKLLTASSAMCSQCGCFVFF